MNIRGRITATTDEGDEIEVDIDIDSGAVDIITTGHDDSQAAAAVNKALRDQDPVDGFNADEIVSAVCVALGIEM